MRGCLLVGNNEYGGAQRRVGELADRQMIAIRSRSGKLLHGSWLTHLPYGLVNGRSSA